MPRNSYKYLNEKCSKEYAHLIDQIRSYYDNPRKIMLWSLFIILLILWVLGFGFHIAGSLVHILLVAAFVVLIIQLLRGGKKP